MIVSQRDGGGKSLKANPNREKSFSPPASALAISGVKLGFSYPLIPFHGPLQIFIARVVAATMFCSLLLDIQGLETGYQFILSLPLQ